MMSSRLFISFWLKSCIIQKFCCNTCRGCMFLWDWPEIPTVPLFHTGARALTHAHAGDQAAQSGAALHHFLLIHHTHTHREKKRHFSGCAVALLRDSHRKVRRKSGSSSQVRQIRRKVWINGGWKWRLRFLMMPARHFLLRICVQNKASVFSFAVWRQKLFFSPEQQSFRLNGLKRAYQGARVTSKGNSPVSLHRCSYDSSLLTAVSLRSDVGQSLVRGSEVGVR